ncbi:MAG: TIGR00341 family protein [Planctomycetota bacterium]
MLDVLERQFTGTEGFRVILLPVEATIPRPPEPEPEPEPPPRSRVGREELLDDLASGTRITTVYLALVVLSTIVAAVGLMRDNVAVVIGAMVIAPLLTPNVALALATALGDFELMRKALKTNLIGIATALVFAVVVGAVLPRVDSAEIASRTETGFADIILALAAGAAGALVFTTGVPATLVGVMVAVALLPPLVTAGLRLAAGGRGRRRRRVPAPLHQRHLRQPRRGGDVPAARRRPAHVVGGGQGAPRHAQGGPAVGRAARDPRGDRLVDAALTTSSPPAVW